MDQKLAGQLTKLFEARRRRAMLLGFAEAPVAMLNAAIAAAVRVWSVVLRAAMMLCWDARLWPAVGCEQPAWLLIDDGNDGC
jgi:hypothetical protein